jgi:hypothetical protein
MTSSAKRDNSCYQIEDCCSLGAKYDQSIEFQLRILCFSTKLFPQIAIYGHADVRLYNRRQKQMDQSAQ